MLMVNSGTGPLVAMLPKLDLVLGLTISAKVSGMSMQVSPVWYTAATAR